MNNTESQPEQQAKGASEAPGVKDAKDARIQELEAQLKEKESRYLYLYAEFENYKKRAIKERADLLKFGFESQARELLQVCDNLDRAIAHAPTGTDKNLVDGLHMVINQFRATLQKQGVQTVDSLHQNFDPNVHEAVGQEPSEHPAGTVVREELKGYTLHGRLLRPSRVVISSGNNTRSAG
ncbi:MAG: nucleotide exchange factor GrpE [Oligoflexia bacterium]|nr:nucleotide exchange factor GrpE [Oligoflexia bacterium]